MQPPKSWDLQIDPSVIRTLQHIPKGDASKILGAIHLLPGNPFYGDIQKMKGEENVWRRRVGSYRLFYKLVAQKRTILVFQVERRTSTTY